MKRWTLGAVAALLVCTVCAYAQSQIVLRVTHLRSAAAVLLTLPTSASDTLVGRASTDTLTNKTLDTEGTGNNITVPFTEFWPAAVVDGGAYSTGWNIHTYGVDAPTDMGNGPSGALLYGTMRFDDSATESIMHFFPLPSDWTGAVDVKILWDTAATSGNVVWQVSTFCVADNENMDPASWTFNTAQTVTDASKGSGGLLNFASISPVTMTGCSAGELLLVQLLRNPAHASDTLGNYADFVGMQFTYRRAL